MSDLTSKHINGSSGTSRLMTFRPPKPSRALITALGPLNRWLTLGGIPGLRLLPVLRHIPGIRGVMNVERIEFPAADERTLRKAASDQHATFIVPNHPEFFTDWMLDKEIMSRVAPMAASWATHSIVNGMGRQVQNFWLKTNLIAQIPGKGGAQGKAYSIEHALAGKAVLLHPEGSVGWHGDLIAPLFPGAIDMACETVKRLATTPKPPCPGDDTTHVGTGINKDGPDAKGGHDTSTRRVLVAPVIWKLTFNRDVEPALHDELSYIETALRLPATAKEIGLANRLYRLYDALLARLEIHYGVHPTNEPYFARQQQLVQILVAKLQDHLDLIGAEPADDKDVTALIRHGGRWLRGGKHSMPAATMIRTLMDDLTQLQRFRHEFYRGAELTQEHIAESLKRIRNDHCFETARDKRHKFLPQPVGPRTAHIRVPEPLDIASLMAAMTPTQMVDELRQRMQDTLDTLNAELAVSRQDIRYANPFIAHQVGDIKPV